LLKIITTSKASNQLHLAIEEAIVVCLLRLERHHLNLCQISFSQHYITLK